MQDECTLTHIRHALWQPAWHNPGDARCLMRIAIFPAYVRYRTERLEAEGGLNTHVHHPPLLQDALFDNVHKPEKSLSALSIARLLDCATLVAVERLPYVR